MAQYRVGSKAAQYRVVYSAGGIDNVVNGSIKDITSAMRSRFPELVSVTPTFITTTWFYLQLDEVSSNDL